MIYFIYGQDAYRAKRKLDEMVLSYKKVRKSGLNLIYTNAKEVSFKEFYSQLKINSMFAEKKLVVLRNTFDNVKFQEEFLEKMKDIENTEDIVVIYQDEMPDKRTKFFKALQKNTKSQEFDLLNPAELRKWVAQELGSAKINPDALDLLISFIGSDLWAMKNEINKLINYKVKGVIEKKDIELLVKPNIENNIFETIEAIASKNKKLALALLHKYFDEGETPLRLLVMITYQFKNLLIIKELQDSKKPYNIVVKKSGLHPFVAQKAYYMSQQFSMEKLKKIYRNIFQVDSDIKTGKIEAETALDLLLAEI